MAWTVAIDTYSLELGDVGKYVTPMARFPHRTPGAALRRLGSCIGGKLARGYPNGRRFYVLDPSGREWTWSDLRDHVHGPRLL